MLRVRPDGKLSSPGKQAAPEESGVKRRGRPKTKSVDSFDGTVIIKYGKRKKGRLIFGQKIEAILSAPPAIENISSSSSRDRKASPVSMKPTHPFFTGGVPRVQDKTKPVKGEEAAADPPTQAPSATKLTSPKKARVNSKPPGIEQNHDEGVQSGLPTFGSDHARVTRFPGAKEPLWPPDGMVHVGKPSDLAATHSNPHRQRPTMRSERKLKESRIRIAAQDEVLRPIIDYIKGSYARANDRTQDAQLCHRPRRHIMSGRELQKAIRPRTSHNFPTISLQDGHDTDELSDVQDHSLLAPPALIRIYEQIPTSRTAFDKFECEPKDWAHKYAPKMAAHALQQGREATLIRDWLKSLTVSSVTAVNASATVSKHLKPSRRKRKRAKALDGFVVSSDEEAAEMAGLSDSEGLDSNGPANVKKTVVRVDGHEMLEPGQRVSHSIVVSGPSGCGKSAAVHAIAQELGFEVFEINPGSRRSGRDIMDKVGDMTRNHLVKNQHATELAVDEPEEKEHDSSDEKLRQDIQSGRQGTMNSFFQTKRAKKKPSPKKKKDFTGPQFQKPVKEAKSQKQSLILLEEVDILFEEDKLFWPTILELLLSTRRPVIMTCNDESLLPLDDMALHGIFRFAPSPEPLAVDYLLLIACSEGHLLPRDAVSALYLANGLDLRHTLYDLQFHCQMALGDRKGGLEWMLLDQTPEVQSMPLQDQPRVVSEGTYQSGLGWLGSEVRSDHPVSSLENEVDLLLLACNEWDIDFDTGEIYPTAGSGDQDIATKEKNLMALSTLDQSLGANSLANILPTKELRQPHMAPLDPTQPKISDKLRTHFIDGLPLLQADTLEDETGLLSKLALTLRVMAVRHINTHRKSIQTRNPRQEITASISHPTINPHQNSSSVAELISQAFDPIAHSQKPALGQPKGPQISSFEAPLSTITQDLAPYIRSIVAYDLRLEEQRRELSAALSQPGKAGGKTRRTRASRAALEGGSKANTRRERWFPNATNFDLVLKTGGEGWGQTALEMETEMGKGGVGLLGTATGGGKDGSKESTPGVEGEGLDELH